MKCERSWTFTIITDLNLWLNGSNVVLWLCARVSVVVLKLSFYTYFVLQMNHWCEKMFLFCFCAGWKVYPGWTIIIKWFAIFDFTVAFGGYLGNLRVSVSVRTKAATIWHVSTVDIKVVWRYVFNTMSSPRKMIERTVPFQMFQFWILGYLVTRVEAIKYDL